MKYTYQVTGDTTEIYDEQDADAVPKLLVPHLRNETREEHVARVENIVAAMNGGRTGGDLPIRTFRVLHDLVESCQRRGDNHGMVDLTLDEAETVLMEVGQKPGHPFDTVGVELELDRLERLGKAARIRADAIDEGLEMHGSHHDEMVGSKTFQSGDMARAIAQLQKAIAEGTAKEGHAAGCAVAAAAYALHQEVERVSGTARTLEERLGGSIMVVMEARHAMRAGMPGDLNTVLALEVEAMTLKMREVIDSHARS